MGESDHGGAHASFKRVRIKGGRELGSLVGGGGASQGEAGSENVLGLNSGAQASR